MRSTIVLCLLLPFVLGSCATTSGLIGDEGEGTSKVYGIPQDKTWAAARAVLAWKQASDLEEHKEDGCITAELPATFSSWGGVVAVWVESLGSSRSRVTVLTRRKWPTSVGTPLTEAEFYESLAKAVKIIEAGTTLPETEPGD